MKSKLRFPLWAKTLTVLILSVSLVSIVAVLFSAATLRDITRNHYIEHSIEVADTLGIYVDLDDVKALKNKVNETWESLSEEEKVGNSNWGTPEWEAYLKRYEEVLSMPEYTRLFKQVETFHIKNDAKYTYLCYADFEEKRLIYLVDDSPEEERCLPGSFDNFTESDMSIFDHMNNGFTPEITNMPEYGYLVAVGRPIFDENKEIVAFANVDLSMNDIVARENAQTINLVIILSVLSVTAVTVGFLLVFFIVIKPVRKLTKAAKEYTSETGDTLNKFSEININTRDEIEDLANSMKKMEEDINQFIDDLLFVNTKLEGTERRVDELKHIADVDALTGVGNKRAYFEVEERLNDEIKNNRAYFAISMVDLNDLKLVNDTLGHEKGDSAIVILSKIIRRSFPSSAIFRIGGDEFVIISEKEATDNAFNAEKRFSAIIEKTIRNRDRSMVPVSAAIGTAIFNPDMDNTVEDTFKRADSKMYINKKHIKEKYPYHP